MRFLYFFFSFSGFFLFSCASYVGKVGENNYPSFDQAVNEAALKIKGKLPGKTSLLVYVSEKNNQNAEIAEALAVKITEIGAPDLCVVERKDMDKALEELERQASDLFDQNETVPLGKMIGAKYMAMPESATVKSIYARLYNTEMDRDLIYQKMNLKIKIIELESGKMNGAVQVSYWDISPDQRVEVPRQVKYSSNPRYAYSNPQIIFIPNQVIKVQPLIIQKPQMTQPVKTQQKPSLADQKTNENKELEKEKKKKEREQRKKERELLRELKKEKNSHHEKKEEKEKKPKKKKKEN